MFMVLVGGVGSWCRAMASLWYSQNFWLRVDVYDLIKNKFSRFWVLMYVISIAPFAWMSLYKGELDVLIPCGPWLPVTVLRVAYSLLFWLWFLVLLGKWLRSLATRGSCAGVRFKTASTQMSPRQMRGTAIRSLLRPRSLLYSMAAGLDSLI